MIIGYARVSTKSQNLDLQLKSLEKFGVDKIVSDKISGFRNSNRLDQLLDIELRSGDTLVVWKLDRLNRSAIKLIELLHELRERKINLVSITENIDFSTPLGVALGSMFSVFIELETTIRQERAEAGLEIAKLNGIRLGRPRIDEAKEALALKLYDEGIYSMREITKLSGVSKSTIYRRIKERGEVNDTDIT